MMTSKVRKGMSQQEYIEQLRNLQEKVSKVKEDKITYYKKLTSNYQNVCMDLRIRLLATRVKGKVDAYGEILEMIHTLLKPYEPTPEDIPMDETGAESLDCFMK